MYTINQIRDELREIRYYMSRKEVFDMSAVCVGKNAIEQKIARYNSVICEATPRLYDLYVSLYLHTYTQESLSEKLGYSIEYVSRLNTQLIKYFQQKLNAEKPA